jgi:hypothetical protein
MISYRDQIETTRSLLLCGFSCTGDGYMTMISYRDQIETTRSLLLCSFSCTGDGYMTMISYRDQIETTWSLLLCGFSCTGDLIKEKILFTCNRWFLHFPFDLYTQKYLLSSNYHDMNIISLFSNVTHYNDITNVTYYHWYGHHIPHLRLRLQFKIAPLSQKKIMIVFYWTNLYFWYPDSLFLLDVCHL